MVSRRVGWAIAFASSTVIVVVAAPPGFPTSGNGIWFAEPGRGFDFWADDWLPVGNGYLAGQFNDVIYGLVLTNPRQRWSTGKLRKRLPS